MDRKPNKLARTIAKLDKLPAFMRPWALDKAIGNTVKLVGTAGIHFETLTNHELVATQKNVVKMRNHIGQIHAAAMILLAETATGILVGMNIPDNKLPLIKSLDTKFVRRTQGDMKAVATLTDEQIELIHSTDKGETIVPVKVTDATGEEVIEVEALWAWILKKNK